jgi:hypothetical protein
MPGYFFYCNVNNGLAYRQTGSVGGQILRKE